MSGRVSMSKSVEAVLFLPRWVGLVGDRRPIGGLRLAVTISALLMTGALSSISSVYPAVVRGEREVAIRRAVKMTWLGAANLVGALRLLASGSKVRRLSDATARLEAALDWSWRPLSFYVVFYPAMVCLKLLVQFTLIWRDVGPLPAIAILGALPSMTLHIFLLVPFLSLLQMTHSLQRKVLDLTSPLQIVHIQEQVVEICETSNQIFNVQIFLCSVNIFLFFILNIYFEAIKPFSEKEVIIHISWLVVLFAPFVHMLLNCRKNTAVAREVNEKVYECMVSDDTDEMIKNEMLEFHASCCRELSFNACGFYHLDTSIIFSMIACGTTYLVILLQYTYHSPNIPTPTCNNTGF